jgi:hypothetical protein
MQKVARNDCVEAANPSLARRTRFQLLAQRGIGRKYGHTVDALCGNPLCIRDEHVVYRQWKMLTRPTKWGEYAEKLAALKVGKSFEIAAFFNSIMRRSYGHAIRSRQCRTRRFQKVVKTAHLQVLKAFGDLRPREWRYTGP